MRSIFAAAALVLALCTGALAQSVPGQRIVPIGYCQLGTTALSAAVALSKCVRASFTASAGSNSTQLVVTSVTGVILVGDQIVSGTGLTAGTTIQSQVSGTPGGAGTYQLSATNTASSAAVTSGGIPPGATGVYMQAEVANVRYRDDGGAPTAAIGNLLISGQNGLMYTGTLTQLQFIDVSGNTSLLDVAFYR